MPDRKPLSNDAIEVALADLPGWRCENESLKKTFNLSSFREAVSFIVRLAFEAETRNHHPELFNVYNRVEITLRTHDAGDRVTENDVALARAIEHFSWT